MKKIMLCLAILLTGCTSQAAASMAPVMNNKTDDNSVIPESDDFFADSVEAEPAPDNTPAPVPTAPAPDRTPDETQIPVTPPAAAFEEANFGFSTPVHPDDFSFYTSVVYDGVPEDAEYPSLKYAEGMWKYYLSDNTVSEDGTFFEEYGYAELALDRVNNEVVISLHPALGGDGFELYEYTEDPGYEPFRGGRTDEGALKLIGNETVLYIIYYYAWQGRECISGEAWFSEEDQGMFIMTRGQE